MRGGMSAARVARACFFFFWMGMEIVLGRIHGRSQEEGRRKVEGDRSMDVTWPAGVVVSVVPIVGCG